MDADLQDSPDEIPALYQMITRDGFDLVSGWKKVRHDPLSKTIPSRFFNWVTSKVSKIKLHDFNCGLKAYRMKVVKSIEVYGEMHRYIPLIAKWSGFKKIGEKVVQHHARKYGKSKFGMGRLITGRTGSGFDYVCWQIWKAAHAFFWILGYGLLSYLVLSFPFIYLFLNSFLIKPV